MSARLVFILAVFLLAGGVAAANPAARGAALNAQGQTQFKSKNYAGALESFERAYEAYPSAGLLVNIGTTYQQLGRAVDAANAYQRYLDDPGAQEPLASQTEQSLAILDTMAGRIAIVVDGDPEDEAEIQIGDGAWMPRARAHLLRVAPGTFVVRARLGDRTGETSGRIDAGEAQQIEVALDAETVRVVAPRIVPPLDDDPVPPRGAHRSRAIPIVTAGAGLVALGTAVALALRASSRYAEASVLCGADERCPVGELARARARSLAGAARTDRLLAIGLGVAGVAAVSVGAVLWIKTPRAAGDSGAALTFVTTPDQVGLAVAGTF